MAVFQAIYLNFHWHDSCIYIIECLNLKFCHPPVVKAVGVHRSIAGIVPVGSRNVLKLGFRFKAYNLEEEKYYEN